VFKQLFSSQEGGLVIGTLL